MNRIYVDSVTRLGDRVLYLAGVFAWAGFNQQALQLVKIPRQTNHKSSYGLARKVLLVVDSFSSFSVAPLYLLFFTGIVIWFTSMIYGGFILIRKILEPEMVLTGFTSMMLSVWFLGGLIVVALGIIGLYIAKIFQEVKRRPLYITNKTHEGNKNE